MSECEQWHKSVFGGMFRKAPEQPAVARDLATLPRAWMDFQIGGARPRRPNRATYERQECLQHIADFYFVVEVLS